MPGTGKPFHVSHLQRDHRAQNAPHPGTSLEQTDFRTVLEHLLHAFFQPIDLLLNRINFLQQEGISEAGLGRKLLEESRNLFSPFEGKGVAGLFELQALPGQSGMNTIFELGPLDHQVHSRAQELA